MSQSHRRTWRLTATLLAWAGWCICTAAPQVIVFQLRVPSEPDNDTNMVLAPYVAESIDIEGRAQPVSWTLGDPVMQQWIQQGKLKSCEPNAPIRDVLAAASKVGSEFVLAVTALRVESGLVVQSQLYRAGKRIWQFDPDFDHRGRVPVSFKDGKPDQVTNDQNARAAKGQATVLTVYINGQPDWDQTMRSAATTLNLQLSDGPWADLEPRPRLTVADPDPAFRSSQKLSLEEAMAKARALLDGNDPVQAVAAYRVAVDIDPFSIEARKGMAQALLGAGLPELAAHEARSLAVIAANDPRHWLLAAEAELELGRAKEAREDLNQALARGMSKADAQELDGLICLLERKFEAAGLILGQLKSPRAVLGLMLAAVGLGEAADAKSHAADCTFTGLATYDWMFRYVQYQFGSLSEDVLKVQQQARMKGKDAQTVALAQTLSRNAEALSSALSHVKPPDQMSDSHGSMSLACSLLFQASLEALEFTQSLDPDRGEEAAVSLGEAMRMWPIVAERHAIDMSRSRSK